MSYFTKPGSTDRTPNAPLSRDRVEAFLAGKGWNYGIDDDGDLGGGWDGNVFYFFVQGSKQEILQVRGRWHRTLPAEEHVGLVMLANDFNQRKVWPKVFCRVEGERVAIYTEVATDLEFGVADDQLGQLVECGLYSGLQFFEQLDEQFPAPDADASDANTFVEDRPL
ncbi:YbjN domain-containing protein [Oerskovia sp. NPDC056781]|uniref:YbjN domain-containing protein n=1 Tax=Oerskovia rustica TaxID=2762237 RepID=A0ABR8RRA9_9CELL|nr:YbjN domain-containing protein [Oerskovia rustica]MBD7950187.1 YbjN domain-containing protein [Oerskovia rustica]